MTATTNAGDSAELSELIYRRILGGRQSDILLHGKVLELVRDLVPGIDVLDTGIGNASLTQHFPKLRPRSLVISDFDQSAVDKGLQLLREQGAEGLCRLYGTQLDIAGDLANLGGRKFGLINCVSVAMHIGPELATSAIRGLCSRLVPGGMLLFGVIDSNLAHELYIPAPRVGPDWFYPRLKGLEQPTEECVLRIPGAQKLAEYYSRNGEYPHAMTQDGFDWEVVHALIGDECNGTIYADFRGRPLWNIYKVCRRT